MTNKVVLTSGLALFAMFFGAGNIIYPLALGAHAGSHFPYVAAAFLISGIGLPLLGLFATSLYHGDYWAFFRSLGKGPAFILIMCLILIIGPLIAAPRTATISFHSIEPFLPNGLNNLYVFNALYCLIIFSLTYKQQAVVDIIGRILSPIKLALFSILILAGLGTGHDVIPNTTPLWSSITLGIEEGYSTMDLLATFFFCSIVCQNIIMKMKQNGIHDTRHLTKIFLLSCLVGGLLLGVVYMGFMLVALHHAAALQGIETSQMIVVVSEIVLGKFGSIFVGACVTFACLVTATALTEVTTEFFYDHVVNKKVPRLVCLLVTLITFYIVSIMGFAWIMKVALPLLEVLYPALILYCIIKIVIKVVTLRRLLPQEATSSS